MKTGENFQTIATETLYDTLSPKYLDYKYDIRKIRICFGMASEKNSVWMIRDIYSLYDRDSKLHIDHYNKQFKVSINSSGESGKKTADNSETFFIAKYKNAL